MDTTNEPRSVGAVTPQFAKFSAPLALRSGASIGSYELAYEMYGSLNAEIGRAHV